MKRTWRSFLANRRVRGTVIAAAAAASVCVPGAVIAQDSDEESTTGLKYTLVAEHDLGVILGIIPEPITQYGGEAVELMTNIALKYVPPDITAPASIEIDPRAAAPADAMYSSDGCGIDFELLSAQAGFENMLGLVSFRDAYFDERTNTEYLFKDRWGFLGKPEIWHANSSADLFVGSLGATRRYEAATGGLSDWYVPIDGNLDEPQDVHLPIGQHGVVWSAGTEINYLGDIAFPGVLLAAGVLTELKWGSAGVDAAKQVKRSGVGDTADAATASRMRRAADKFGDFIKRTLKKMTGTDPDDNKPFADALKDEIKCFFGDVLISTLASVRDLGLDTYSSQDIEQLEADGLITRTEAVMLEAIRLTSPGVDVTIAVAMALADCNDPDETILETLSIVLDTADFDFMEVFSDYTQFANSLQSIIIWDSVPPTLSLDPAPLVFEATDFGGTRLSRIRNELFAIAEAGAWDNCGRMPTLSVDAPELLPIGDTVVTWRAQDLGPNPDDGQDYGPEVTQTIRVEDTQPPLLLAPPSRVIESNVAVSNPEIGDAVAVDLADVQPVIANNAPASFPVNERVAVTWTATDASGNAAEASQLVTVKAVGFNNAPTANSIATQTLTAEPVDIRLTASDPDELDDRADPLWFKIEARPQHGEFVAPLFPFFIEDYRTRPNDGLGDTYDPEVHDLRAFIQTNYCDTDFPDNQRIPPRNFVHDARYVHVTDEGTRYVLDDFWACKDFDDNPDTFARFSKWSADGEFLGQVRIGSDESDRPEGDSFVLDRDGYLYYLVDTDTGSSNEIFLNRCETDWDGLQNTDTSQQCVDSYKFDSSSVAGSLVDAGSLRYVRFDSKNNVAYVADQFSVFAFELLDTGGSSYLGEVGPRDENGDVVVDWAGEAQALEVGPDGSLYVADIGHHRIHKIAPIQENDEGVQVPGDYIGWSGRCTGSGNNSCDVDRQRSRGYSCTFEPDSCTVQPADRAGDGQGQFDTPRYIALDPNGVLYVADYGNERIQRLSPDGSFAGEAVSDGSGINKGDRPSFVLGNMGAPASVSVNSSQFYVVDRAEQFVHVFGTLPFKDITDDAATVTYVSDQAFPNPNASGNDAFTFSVSDGLAESPPATATITVNRNYRPPIALAAWFSTDEDETLDLTLPAEDPDGIAGKDFLGLDTLTYTITKQPEHGGLAGLDADWVYTPEPDFFGEDSFSFMVNDGYDDSEEATVSIEVLPVNDAPKVSIDLAERVGLGFPTVIRADFADDPSASHEGTVAWGDGQSDVTGGVVNPDGENPYLDGVAITAPPPGQLDGFAIAQHTYETTGPRTVEACLTDSDGAEGCASAVLLVEELASIGLQARVLDPANPLVDDEFSKLEVMGGAPYTYEVQVSNGIPYVGTGLAADNLTLNAELEADVNILSASVGVTACVVDAALISCDIGTLQPGETAVVEVDVIGPLDPGADPSRTLAGIIETTADAIEPVIEFDIAVDIESVITDSDGDGMPDSFEIAFGLNPAVDDSGEDLDGDGLDNLTEFELGTSPADADTDRDGLGDFEEANGNVTSPTTADSDGDGMPDGWEVANEFDPADPTDADGDADSDGLSNVGEFAAGKNPRADDVAPVITAPPVVSVTASGRMTQVDLGEVLAVDAAEGNVAAIADFRGPWATGSHLVSWTAADSLGNAATAQQQLNIVPLANFGIDQVVAEGETAIVRVELNGPAVQYPVTIPYTVTGSALNPGDHNGMNGEILIASGVAGAIEVDVAIDAIAEGDETLQISMGNPVNAARGSKTTHAVRITESNLPPRVSIVLAQQGVPATMAGRDAGPVTATAVVSDTPADSHSFDWSGGDPATFEASAVNSPEYDFDPAGLAPGIYTLQVTVTDDGTPAAATTVSTLLHIVDSLPALSAASDSDGDGVSDQAEGHSDADGDRIPAWLDAYDSSAVLPLAGDQRWLETLTGLGLRAGLTAFAAANGTASLAEADVVADPDFAYPDGLLDFEITGIEPGGEAVVVIPLGAGLSAAAVYRKLAAGSWADFDAGEVDSVASAEGADGACPPPLADAYESPMSTAHRCLQLTLTDGGPNDADGIADGVIKDPGGLGVPVGAEIEALGVDDQDLEGDGVYVVVRLRLSTESGDTQLRSLTLSASGTGDDTSIDEVALVHDLDGDGIYSTGDQVLGTGTFGTDNGELFLQLAEPVDMPAGTMDVLVTYGFGASVN